MIFATEDAFYWS